jgi:hypothetical protein
MDSSNAAHRSAAIVLSSTKDRRRAVSKAGADMNSLGSASLIRGRAIGRANVATVRRDRNSGSLQKATAARVELDRNATAKKA